MKIAGNTGATIGVISCFLLRLINAHAMKVTSLTPPMGEGDYRVTEWLAIKETGLP